MKGRIVYLLEKYLSHKISLEEKQELRLLMQDEKRLNERLKSLFTTSSEEWNDADKKRIFHSIKTQITDNKAFQSQNNWLGRFKWTVGIAALLTLALGWSLYLNLRPIQVQQLTVLTRQDEKSTVILPDQTTIHLNAKSKILYSSNYSQDRIVYFKGEGFFQVTHNPNRPFIVRCEEVSVKVLGTKFNLRAYPDKKLITAVLNEGKIEMMTPNGVYALQPNEKITYNKKTHEVSIEKVHANHFSDWRKVHLVVDSMSLGELALKIEEMYDVRVRFDSSELANIRLTGTIDNHSLHTVLDMIRLSTGIEYKNLKNEIYFYCNSAN